ncbi:MAG: hypothetical protein HYS44_01695 [Candidatus Niyogibacteria bacterium]|nr:hypothetical protein [Candidatus Niyogibacteria bacterium]
MWPWSSRETARQREARKDAAWEARKKDIEQAADRCKELAASPHAIRKMFSDAVLVAGQKTSSSGGINGSFFLFAGELGGSFRSESEPIARKMASVEFMWALKATEGSEYVYTKLPLSKIRVKPVENCEFPTVQFSLDIRYGKFISWRAHLCTVPGENICNHSPQEDFERDPQLFLERHLQFALVTCGEEHWQSHIGLPLSDEHIQQIKAANRSPQ